MWFKNLTLFRFTEPFKLSASQLTQQLESLRFRPCGAHDESSFGWSAPLGRHAEELVYQANGFLLLCGKKEQKLLPSSVINELLEEKINDLETRQARKLSKKERTTLKDELTFELLPKAFSLSRYHYLYIDPKGGWLVVDSATAKKAEDLVSYLRRCLGSLPVVPLRTRETPMITLTEWLTNQRPPAGITIEDECELRSLEAEGSIVRCKKHDLSLPEIKHHLNSGKQVIKLALNWQDRLAFVIDEHLSIKRLRFLEIIQEQRADIHTEDELQNFDADFSMMTLELAQFLPQLLILFGGEQPFSS